MPGGPNNSYTGHGSPGYDDKWGPENRATNPATGDPYDYEWNFMTEEERGMYDFAMNQPGVGYERDRQYAQEMRDAAEKWLTEARGGKNSVAQQQLRAGLGAAQRAGAQQAIGRGSNPLAQRAAVYSGGQMAGEANTQSAALRAAEWQSAQQMQMDAIRMQEAQAMAETQSELARQDALRRYHLGLWGQEEGADQAKYQQGQEISGQVIQALAMMMASDERAKTDIQPVSDAAYLGGEEPTGAPPAPAPAQVAAPPPPPSGLLAGTQYYQPAMKAAPTPQELPTGPRPAGMSGVGQVQPFWPGPKQDRGIISQITGGMNMGKSAGAAAGGGGMGGMFSGIENKTSMAPIGRSAIADPNGHSVLVPPDFMPMPNASQAKGMYQSWVPDPDRPGQMKLQHMDPTMAGGGFTTLQDYSASDERLKQGYSLSDKAAKEEAFVEGAAQGAAAAVTPQQYPHGRPVVMQALDWFGRNLYDPAVTAISPEAETWVGSPAQAEYGQPPFQRMPLATAAAPRLREAYSAPPPPAGSTMTPSDEQVKNISAALDAEGDRTLRELMGAGGDPAAAEMRRRANERAAQIGAELDRADDETLASLRGYTYRYKPEAQQRLGLDGRPKYGIMAQDVERTPLGQTMVVDTPQGKMIDQGAATGATLAMLGRLDERDRGLIARMQRIEEMLGSGGMR